ncbi:MAG TPA: 16S rRNA (adenine(1518)-N(6)/adenine(1519)-N(6))-dimethyltransferase RsmA [Candidatus Polarisedimenticolia bacterium]|nr:16S rRNA (adenine(1518)-N(6)/adenine(1519)-N(6))-dimethyltransferase RsmA [Candidatus Polarisedimenticolia bacterium]
MSKRSAFPRRTAGPTSRRPASRRRRALGQHFLTNASAARRLVELFAPAPGEKVIEIGPGRGALTGLLLEAGASVTAIEVDAALAAELGSRHQGHPGLTLVQADVLRCDLAALASPAARVMANLPYAITGEVLARLFEASPPITGMLLMLQREVVERIVAAPGGREYGSLSMLCQYVSEPKVVMSLSPGSFSPPPAVSSSVVHLPVRPVRELAREQETGYALFIRTLFAHRRQTLLNNLKAAGHGTEPARDRLAALGIDPARRPETLTREEGLALYRAMAPRS